MPKSGRDVYLGQKQAFRTAIVMSALPLKGTLDGCQRLKMMSNPPKMTTPSKPATNTIRCKRVCKIISPPRALSAGYGGCFEDLSLLVMDFVRSKYFPNAG